MLSTENVQKFQEETSEMCSVIIQKFFVQSLSPENYNLVQKIIFLTKSTVLTLMK